MTLRRFVKESNRIEGITYTTPEDLRAHRTILDLELITVADVEAFVQATAHAELRRYAGMNVRIVGGHYPIPGGPEVERRLASMLDNLNNGADVLGGGMSPYFWHAAFEYLHPFMDGNGRSGRVLWAWMMRRDGLDPFALPFLHRWYYQSLDAFRETLAAEAEA